MLFGYMKEIDEGKLMKRIYRSEAERFKRKGRPSRRWRDGVEELMERRDFSFEECKSYRKLNSFEKW